jgi:hypothetical protein
MKKLLIFLPILLLACMKEPEYIIPKPPPYNFTFQLDSALNGSGTRALAKDKAGYYHLKLSDATFQTFSRITGKFLWNGKPNPIPSPVECWIEWKSSHYWLLNNKSALFVVYKTYFNEFTGKLTTSELGTFKSQSNQLIPTINSSSYPSSTDGSVNTIVAPIYPMRGDTMIITAMCHISKEIPTSKLFVRIERDSIERKMRIICE